MTYRSPLRDLADLIQRTAMEHPAYGQASASVLNCVDHLCAMARNEEANRTMQQDSNEISKLYGLLKLHAVKK